MNGVSFNKSAILGDMDELTTALSNHISNKNNPHQVTADQVNAVKKTGDTMTGTLNLEYGDLNHSPNIQIKNPYSHRIGVIQEASDGRAQFWNMNEEGDGRFLSLRSENEALANAITIAERIEGQDTVYRLFGEHNVDQAYTALGYVKKTGDTMSGNLNLRLDEGPVGVTLYNNATGRAGYIMTGEDNLVGIGNRKVNDYHYRAYLSIRPESDTANLPTAIRFSVQQGENSDTNIYTIFGTHNLDLTRTQLDLVRKSGDTMTGNLMIQTGSAGSPANLKVQNTYSERTAICQEDSDGAAQLWNWKDNQNSQFLSILPETSELAQSIKFTRRVGGSSTQYNLYGAHNTDLLATAIQNMFSGGNLSVVKSVQRGVKASGGTGGDQTITITSVNLNKSHACLLGVTGSDGAYAYVTLTNSTTLTVHFGANGTSQTVSWEVIEFY